MRQDQVPESKLTELREEFGGLIKDETLARIANEEEVDIMDPKSNVKKIVDLKDREEVTIELEVVKVSDTRQFEKRTGGQGRVRNINVKDETGTCRLALWDNDVEMVESLGIQPGTKLRCVDCYVKKTDFGTDVSKGRKGKIEKL
jgi:replication factor A1